MSGLFTTLTPLLLIIVVSLYIVNGIMIYRRIDKRKRGLWMLFKTLLLWVFYIKRETVVEDLH